MADSKNIADRDNLWITPHTGQTLDTVNVKDTSGNVQLRIAAAGGVFLPNLGTSNPAVAGQLWANSSVVTLGTTS